MIQYVVDAFTDRVFQGNPAAVCVLDAWPADEWMQKVAMENNLSETAFIVPEGVGWRLRWFTPGGEIDLCGHATLAAAYTLFRFYCPKAEQVSFTTLSGSLRVRRDGGRLEMDFPAYPLRQVPVTPAMEAAIGVRPAEAWMGRDLLCVLEREEDVLRCRADLEQVLKLEGLLLHITARGREYDCVSRTFAPKCGIPEDPVCGSGHCHIVPYWLERLGVIGLTARQASARGGTLFCRMEGDRVFLSGQAVLYAKSEVYADENGLPVPSSVTI
ncbi:MAG: PhzF family phenazine biosynthesis protein [Oscillibacter sp.]|nr:PhzF family phenazine biosynthesis protein [Oscillibacter sp.]